MSADIKTLRALQQSARNITVPFSIQLPDGSNLVCTEILRLLPGKRIVAKAEYLGKIVLAKIFFDVRNTEKEIAGYSLLQNTGVNTPALTVHQPLEQGAVCLYEFIDNAVPLDQLWQESDDTQKTILLNKLLAVLQSAYQQQVLQRDLHLGNFLLQGDVLWMLDPASCASFKKNEAIRDNLSLLQAQLPFADWPLLVSAICNMFSGIDIDSLVRLAKQYWQQRKKYYLKKIFRDNSEIADISSSQSRILCKRALLSDKLIATLNNPITLLASARTLKAGNSATVLLSEIDGQTLVFKRYRDKDLWRKLRRLLRPSRAARSWHFSHALLLAGINIPAPVALIENGPRWNRDTWFVSEYIQGKDLLSHWQNHPPSDSELQNMAQLFSALEHAQMSHGDMKATNLIVSNDRLYLIDYDGMQEPSSQKSLHHVLARDRARCLRNWPAAAWLDKLAGAIKA